MTPHEEIVEGWRIATILRDFAFNLKVPVRVFFYACLLNAVSGIDNEKEFMKLLPEFIKEVKKNTKPLTEKEMKDITSGGMFG